MEKRVLKSGGDLPFGGIGMVSVPMFARGSGQAWPLVVAVGVPAAGAAVVLSRLDWPSRTWSVAAIVVALVPWIRAGYLAVLGSKRCAGAIWGFAGVVVVGVGVLGDGMQIENQMPPGWPAEVPRYPGAWTGRGSVRPGERTWFVRTRVGRASPYEVTYEAAYPHVERLSFGSGDGCSTYRIEMTLLRVCPEGNNEVVVSLENTATRAAR